MSEKTMDELWEMVDELQEDLDYYKAWCEELRKAIRDHLRFLNNTMWDLNNIEKGK